MSTKQYRDMLGAGCPKHAGDPWTFKRDQQLVLAVANDIRWNGEKYASLDRVAKRIGRTYGAVIARLGRVVEAMSGPIYMGPNTVYTEALIARFRTIDWAHFLQEKCMSEKFFMVKGPGATRVQHNTPAEVMDEATRLAKQNPGTKFFIMEAIQVVQVEVAPPPVTVRNL